MPKGDERCEESKHVRNSPLIPLKGDQIYDFD